jgi:hypothetical protein
MVYAFFPEAKVGTRQHQGHAILRDLPPVETLRDWIGEGLRAAGGECHRSLILSYIASRTGLPASRDLETRMVRAFEMGASDLASPFEPRFGSGSHRWRLRAQETRSGQV